MNRVFVVGSSNTDLVVKCSRLPRPGETVLGGDLFRAQGGKGANQAVAAARLGASVIFLCRVGDDEFGKASLDAYTNEGIDLRFAVTDAEAPSGAALILVDQAGENSIAVASGANLKLSEADVEPLKDEMSENDVLLLQLEVPLNTAARAAAIARERKARVILDPAPAPGVPLPADLLRNLDFITPNQHEAEQIGKPYGGVKGLIDLGVKHLLITLDKEGCKLINAEGERNFPAYPVKAVDSTAAGDAFAGALASGLAGGYTLENAISWAQQAAALSVTRMGAQPSLPTRNELLAFDFG